MASKSRVIIRRAHYDATADAAVEEIFASFGTDVAGKKVLVKPNLLSARSPEKAVTTHPAIVAAVIRALERRNPAAIVLGDNSGMSRYGENETVAGKTGILDVARKYYRNLGTSPARVPLHSPYAYEVAISQEILDCDVLISLPKMKTHSLTMLTCGIKNSYGFLLGGEKARLHRAAKGRDAFARTVVDVFSLRVPDLLICDAVRAMQGNGPSSRDVFDYGHILGATDAVALDAVVGRIMGLEPSQVATTAVAAERGLGKADFSEIEIDGKLEPVEGFKLPSSFVRTGFFDFLARITGGLVVSEPRADANVCIRCGLCRDHCPTEAIAMDPFPRIDRHKCIRCYCCLEFCPHEAMKLSSRVRFVRNLAR